MSRIKKNPLSDAPQKTTRTLAKVGIIKTGKKVKNQYGKEYPTSLDYFEADSDHADYVKMFHNVYGEKPKKIPIVFISNDINEVCPQRFELRDNIGKMVAFGDGENFEVVEQQGDKFVYKKWTLADITARNATPKTFMERLAASYSIAKSEETKEYKAEWKEALHLRFVVLGLQSLYGYWELNTFAKETSIPQIVNTIDAVIQQAGRLAMIPFDLCVKKVKSDKSGAKNSYPVISLICNLGTENLALVQQINPKGLLTAGNIENQFKQIAAPQSTPPQNETEYTNYEEVK